jgi:hypothetical protein
MVEYLSASTPTCLVVKIHDKVAVEEYKELVSRLEGAIRNSGSINFVCVLQQAELPDRDKVLTDPYFGYHENRSIGRAAFVGDSQWTGLFARLLTPFTRSQEKFFTHDKFDQALQWACADDSRKGIE